MHNGATLAAPERVYMLLPLAGALCVGLPGLLLGAWFSWLTRRRWLRGGAMLVARTWLLCLAVIAGSLTVLVAPFVNTGFGLPYNAFVCFCVFVVAGGIPSAVIALVVSCLTYWLEEGRGEYESNAILIVVLGTVSGILAAVLAIPLSMSVMDAFWHR
jgi:hypothetical protein